MNGMYGSVSMHSYFRIISGFPIYNIDLCHYTGDPG